MGKLFRSPKKSRPKPYIKKEPAASRIRMQALEMDLAELLAASKEGSSTECDEGGNATDIDFEDTTLPMELDGPPADSPSPLNDGDVPFDNCPPDYPVEVPNPPKTRRVEPDKEKLQVYTRWLNLLPSLVHPYLAYFEKTYQQPWSPSLGHGDHLIGCAKTECVDKHKKSKLLCLYTHPPAQPRQAISIDLLSFFKALFERSSDAAYALANALHTHYERRGFWLRNAKGEAAADPFRKGLTSAMQWYDTLMQQIEKQTRAILKASKPAIPSAPESGPNSLTQCAEIIQARCPACFGGIRFGGKCDIVVSVDGTFNQRHVRSRGDCPHFYEPDYFLPKEYVDQVGKEIEAARKKPAKSRSKTGSQVPDAAIDVCENSHEAGSGSNVKTSLEHFDDGGIMGLVCRHDIPIFLANIDTPGEQQKYAVALLRHLFSLIPTSATVEVLYDVGCVMARSVERYELFPEAVSKRLTFGTSIMHSYAHEFACQIVHNPRYREGVGLSDGEGTERLWSRLGGLIGITRMCARHKRIFFLDRQLSAVGAEMRDSLGTTLRRRAEKNVPHHQATAAQALGKVTLSSLDLLEMWNQQKGLQMSVRSHAPARIKKELDAILTLQTELEAVEISLRSTRSLLASLHSASSISKQLLDALEARQQDISAQVEELYASLNVHESFPELKGVDLEFIRTLLLARDLKINIRKRAIGSFNEYDKMNQAQGGGPAIGTKMHQYIRQSIAKRVPALRRSLRRFNELCARAQKCYKPEWNIPLPQPLPEDITKLKADPGLLEDVWISAAPLTTYKWLYDSDIQLDNLCRWFGQEMRSVEMALVLPENRPFLVVLNHHRSRLLNLKGQWATRSTAALFDSHVATAKEEAEKVYARTVGVVPNVVNDLTWLKPMVLVTVPEPEDDVEEDLFSSLEEPLGGDEWTCASGAMSGEGEASVPETAEADVSLGCEVVEAERGAAVSAPEVLESEGDMEDQVDAPAEPITAECPPVLRMAENSIKVDPSLLQRLEGWVLGRQRLERDTASRVLHVGNQSTARRFVFPVETMLILGKDKVWLDDDCINPLAALLQFKMLEQHGPSSKAGRCSIFSSFDMVQESNLWARTKRLEYWKTSVWIIPIFQHSHWTLAVVQYRTSRIYLFDSFDDHEGWGPRLQRVISLVNLLVGLANDHSHSLSMPQLPWTAHSVTADSGWTAYYQPEAEGHEGAAATFISTCTFPPSPSANMRCDVVDYVSM
ncbi:hypothetical protein MD484_g5010, partial [Candolleomyces efflorescens]